MGCSSSASFSYAGPDLEPGDLYFFFTENIHEVPAVVGDQPRAVLASFFAMSPDDDEIYVWS